MYFGPISRAYRTSPPSIASLNKSRSADGGRNRDGREAFRRAVAELSAVEAPEVEASMVALSTRVALVYLKYGIRQDEVELAPAR